jgi:flagellar hook-basal body complex protein FliE
MNIHQGLTLCSPVTNTMGKAAVEKSAREATTSFGDTLTQAMKDVNGLQQEAGKAVDQMVAGESVDLHDVMIAVEKAKTSFDLLMEVRNKTIDAYRELMRIQV